MKPWICSHAVGGTHDNCLFHLLVYKQFVTLSYGCFCHVVLFKFIPIPRTCRFALTSFLLSTCCWHFTDGEPFTFTWAGYKCFRWKLRDFFFFCESLATKEKMLHCSNLPSVRKVGIGKLWELHKEELLSVTKSSRDLWEDGILHLWITTKRKSRAKWKMLWGIYSAIYGEVNVSVEKCVEIKGDYFEK